MAKAKTQFVCSECGGASLKWQGQCPHCNAWNSLSEARVETLAEHRYGALVSAAATQSLGDVQAREMPRQLEQFAVERAELLGDGHALHETGIGHRDRRLRCGNPDAVEVSNRFRHAERKNAEGGRQNEAIISARRSTPQ